jgi:transposase
MRQQFAVLHKMLLDTVRDDPVCRRLMTAPGVGAVVALTYRARSTSRNASSIRGRSAHMSA